MHENLQPGEPMKTSITKVAFAILSVVIVSACSRESDLKMGMEYSYTMYDSPFSSTVFVFSERGVSVFDVVGRGDDICIRKKDGAILTSAGTYSLRGVGAAKGTILSKGGSENDLEVLFGPGDQVPILESAAYRIERDSVVVDWSQGHSARFGLASVTYHRLVQTGSGSEVFTIKNNGLILESATSPGIVLTMGKKALSAMSYWERLEAEGEELQRKNREAAREKAAAKRRNDAQ